MQESLGILSLRSVSVNSMTTLRDRLTLAMESTAPHTTQAATAKACGISTAAVAGWFGKSTWGLQATHCYAIAKLLRVDPEWLATGKGRMSPSGGPPPSDADRELIATARENDPTFASFVQDYRKLTSTEKTMVRTVVVALARAHDPIYQAYEKTQRTIVTKRDGTPEKAKP